MIGQFRQAMQNAGLEPPAEIIPDGKLNRFSMGNDKSKNSWYAFYSDEPAAGAFGCWKRGITETWCSKSNQIMTPEEKAAHTAKMDAMKRQREEERQHVQAECRALCAETWEKAKFATNDNPYLKRKGVNAYGVKALEDTLLISVQDIDSNIHGIQFIYPDGTKKFKTGTNKARHFFTIGQTKDNTIIISEGYATGASIHQATGHAVIVAFDAGNLLPVANAIRSKFPDMKIIVAADDDHATESNPGLTKATEAAKAVNGFWAVPVFPDNRQAADTDFNDLARLAGLETVKACIEAAAMPTPSPVIENLIQAESDKTANLFGAVVDRLAALSPLEYDRIRKEEAKALGVRPGTLDAAVKAAKKEASTEDALFTEPDPWPEPINPASLLTDIAAIIRRFIVCSQEVSEAAALWIATTWFIDAIQVVPLAAITAPEKQCGKSLLLSIFGKLSKRSITASSISPAALFRTIEAWEPTLLIDEADAFMKDNEELRGILNSGHTRDSAFVIRCVGDNQTPTRFNTFGPKAIAGIGHLADTLMDRSIVLELRRKLPHENAERIRHAEQTLFNDLSSKLARFSQDYSQQVQQARPPLPEALNDRAQDNWEPLLQVAMVAGDEWLQIGTEAALKISGRESLNKTIGVELLSDIQEIFDEKQIDRISTTELIKALCSDEEKPWASYNRGLPIKPRQLANKLKAYGVQSRTIRIGYETAKGYEKNQFADTISRYVLSEKKICEHPPENSVYPSQPAPVLDLSVTYSKSVTVTEPSIRNKMENVTDTQTSQTSMSNTKVTRKPAPVLSCDVVTDRNGKGHTQNILVLTESDFLGVLP